MNTLPAEWQQCSGVIFSMQHESIVRPRLDDGFMLHDFFVYGA